MTITIFYIDDCPNHSPAVDRVNQVLAEMDITADVVNIRVTSAESAAANRFPGSPTVQINGVDVEPSMRTSTQFGMMCRTYSSGLIRQGLPSVEVIRHAVLEALEREC